jgi:hypothetical protein
MQSLDKLEVGDEFCQGFGEGGREGAVKLDGSEAGGLRGGGDRRCVCFGIQGLEDADKLNVRGEVRGYGGDLLERDLTLAWGKDEAESICAELGGEFGIFEVGVAADFEPGHED